MYRRLDLRILKENVSEILTCVDLLVIAENNTVGSVIWTYVKLTQGKVVGKGGLCYEPYSTPSICH